MGLISKGRNTFTTDDSVDFRLSLSHDIWIMDHRENEVCYRCRSCFGACGAIWKLSVWIRWNGTQVKTNEQHDSGQPGSLFFRKAVTIFCLDQGRYERMWLVAISLEYSYQSRLSLTVINLPFSGLLRHWTPQTSAIPFCANRARPASTWPMKVADNSEKEKYQPCFFQVCRH